MIAMGRTDLIMQDYSVVEIRGSVRGASCGGVADGERTKNSTPNRS